MPSGRRFFARAAFGGVGVKMLWSREDKMNEEARRELESESRLMSSGNKDRARLTPFRNTF